MLLYIQTSNEIKNTDNIELVKKIGYLDRCHNSIHNFYVEVNTKDCGGVCGFEGEDEDVFFDYDFDDFLIDILPDRFKASIVDKEKYRYNYYTDKEDFNYTLRIDVDEKAIEKQVNILRIEKEKQDAIALKSFRINSTKKLLSDENISKSIGYCDDYWDKECFNMSYSDANKKLKTVLGCPFDNNLILGTVHHSNDIGWGCSKRCELHSLSKSSHHKKILLNRHLENLKNDVYNDDKLCKEHGTTPLLTNRELEELDIVLEKAEEEQRKQWYIERKYEENHLIKFEGCPSQLFKDFVELNNFGALTEFDDFEFKEDKIIYHYIDYDFFEDKVEINKTNIIFSIMPSMDNKYYEIMIGNGCCVMISQPINDNNKKHLNDFYEKCKSYQK